MIPIEQSRLSEEDIKTRFITPALYRAGWSNEQFRMEHYFTDGRVIYQAGKPDRRKGKKADYLLFGSPNYPIAIVEAKDGEHPVGGGMQQAMEYAQMLDVPFAYSSNGRGFVEHDFLTGKETQLTMDQFPTQDSLLQRLQQAKRYSPQAAHIIGEPYYWDTNTHAPRYYQRIAINKTIEAVATGQSRILLVMATGTGKTFTAFQIIHRLMKSKAKKKVLYLADRNVLIDQTMAQDFKPFSKVMTKVKDKTMDPSYEVYMALYQQLVSNDEAAPDPFTTFAPTFFDLIIVDECHRGSAKEDSEWRKILDYFASATQIGLTATPKVDNEANNLDYFGEPLYTYSLKQGIDDGFLAPYRVTNSFLNIDLSGWSPREGEEDIHGQLIAEGYFSRKDFGRSLAIRQRREIVARRITQMLHQIGRMTKTIVFCTDVEEADAMRQLLVTMNADLCLKDPRYVMRITGDDAIGKRQLDNFIDVDEPCPTVVTTSQMLSTGVDCKTCGLIVIDKEIGSMTEFKQIVGRGTRLRTDKGKWHFEILDFRNATAKFRDQEFDGDPEMPEPQPTHKQRHDTTPPDDSATEENRKPIRHDKYLIDGENVAIATEIVSYLDADGTMVSESITDFTRKKIRRQYQSHDLFVAHWSKAAKKKAIIDELKEYDVLIDAVREANPHLKEMDVFDIICHVAYDKPPITRSERVNNVKHGDYLSRYQGEARQVLEMLLDKYAENGILELEDSNILEVAPLNTFGRPPKIIGLFGDVAHFNAVLTELKNELYKTA